MSRWFKILVVLSLPILLVVALQLWVSYHYYAATSALKQRHIESARSHLAWYLRIWSNDADAWLLAARLERLDNNVPKAEEYLQKSRKLRGEETAAYQLEAWLLRAQSHGFEDEKADLLKFKTQNPKHSDTPFVLECLARGYIARSRFLPAKSLLNEWLDLDPDNPRAVHWRAYVQDQLKQEDEALADYQHAVELAPWNWEARAGYAEMLLRLNDVKNAGAQTEVLIRDHGDRPAAQQVRARYLITQGKFDKARSLLQQVVQADDKNGEALYDLGRVENQQRNYKKAEGWVRKSLKVFPSNIEAHYELFQILRAQGQIDDAAKQHDRYEQIKKDTKRINDLLGPKLERDYENPDLHAELGCLHMRIGLHEEGLRWLNNALQKNPNHAAANKCMVEYYESIGQPERAKKYRQRLRKTSQ